MITLAPFSVDAEVARVVILTACLPSRDQPVLERALDLQKKLPQGDKQLVGNAGYRRFLATPDRGYFAIDPARVAEDERFDADRGSDFNAD